LLIPSLAGGGAERVALNLLTGMPRWRCVVLAEWRGGELEVAPEASGVVAVSNASRKPPRALRIVRLAGALRRLRPEIAVSLLSPLVSMEAGRLAGVPVVQWIQSPYSCVKPFMGQTLIERLNRRVLRRVGRGSAAWLGATPGVLEEFIALGLDPRAMTTLPNPVRLPEPAPEDPEGVTRIVTIGRLAQEKRHDLLLDAFREVRGRHDLRLLIIGRGPLEEALRRQADRLGLGQNVDFRGFTESPADEIGARDVFTLCSDFEGFGNVFVEALARGVRIVATDAPYGARHILGGIDLARLTTPGSPSGIAAALIEAVEAGAPSPDVREQARRRAEQFSVDQVAERFEGILEDVLSRRPLA
jgi:glycosyltransferase involved in cell wall biosynthesis